MSARRCLCGCHEGGVSDRQRVDGVDVADAIAAVTACTSCKPHHCAAFLEMALPNDDRPTVQRPHMPASNWTGEDGG